MTSETSGRRSPLWITACCAWLALLLAVSIKSVVEPVEHSAYPCFEAGSRCWCEGKNLYEMAVCGHEYRYGPAFAVAMAPLAQLPTWLGGLLWNWVNIAAYFCAVCALVRWVLPSPWRGTVPFSRPTFASLPENRDSPHQAAFLLLVLLGAARMIWAAQTNALVFALVAGAAVAIRQERWWWAAVLLAVPVHVKVWPLAAALLMTACWPRQLAWRLAVSLLGVGAIPFLTKPFAWVCSQYHAWFSMLVGPAQIRHVYRDAWTIWELIYVPVNEQGYLALQLAAAAAALGLCWWYRRRATSPAALLTFILALWTAWQMVFGPGTERNTFGLIAPLSAWGLLTALVGAISNRPYPTLEEKRGRVLMCTAFALTTLANFGVVERALADFFPAVVAMHPVGVLLFVAWLLAWAR